MPDGRSPIELEKKLPDGTEINQVNNPNCKEMGVFGRYQLPRLDTIKELMLPSIVSIVPNNFENTIPRHRHRPAPCTVAPLAKY